MNLTNARRLEYLTVTTRRKFFQQCGTGMGALALASLLDENLFAVAAKGAVGSAPAGPHFKPKAKNIIYLFQSGGPSHLDLFDYKPELIKRDGQQMPEEILKNIRLAQIGKKDYLPFPIRWAVASRPVRLQAGTHQTRRSADAGRDFEKHPPRADRQKRLSTFSNPVGRRISTCSITSRNSSNATVSRCRKRF